MPGPAPARRAAAAAPGHGVSAHLVVPVNGTHQCYQRALESDEDSARDATRKALGMPCASHGPVLVVGGGPAGLAAAAELRLHGVDCVVIEPRAEVSHRRPRAKTTSVRTMEHLRRWGVADALRAAAPLPVAWSQRVTFCESLSGRRDHRLRRRVRADDRARRPVRRGRPAGAAAGRGGGAARPPGRPPRRGPAASGTRRPALTQDDGGVTVTVSDEAGAQLPDPRPVRARLRRRVRRDQGSDRRRYVGRSDPRPNFNVVFRAPALDTHLGPAVQYWVVGAPRPGPDRPARPGRHLVGRIPRRRRRPTATAHAAELITGLIGAPGRARGARPPTRGRPGC